MPPAGSRPAWDPDRRGLRADRRAPAQPASSIAPTWQHAPPPPAAVRAGRGSRRGRPRPSRRASPCEPRPVALRRSALARRPAPPAGPARGVGGGNILNNIFYQENFIPGIEGQFLTQLGTNLGVFSKNREEFTMIDFQPVENSMIFYVKETASYKIRDYFDMIETNEGMILNLREGIVVTNGYGRTLISEQINDIIEKNYDNSTIFFNSYLKHLYYFCNDGLFMYDFKTQTWTQFELPEETSGLRNMARIFNSEAPLNQMSIIDYIEDYEGNFYFVTATSIWKVELTISDLSDRPGYFRLALIDASEMNINKIINWLSFDCENAIIQATFKVKNKTYRIGKQAKSTNVRTISYLQNILAQRLPILQLSIDIEFQGKINNIELDIDIVPRIKR